MRRPTLTRLGSAFSLALACLGACQNLSPNTDPTSALVRFDRDDGQMLPPIADREWLAAWPAWLASCRALLNAAQPARSAWQPVCIRAQQLQPQTGGQVRDFFLQHMDRYRVVALQGESAAGEPVQAHTTGLVTAYFEPELEGSRKPIEPFVVPVYRAPKAVPTAARSELQASGQLQGDELLWLRDPLEAFVLEVQGSGRVHLTDGSSVRLAYAANNGHAYRSIGRWLVDQGELEPQAVSLQAIVQWAHAHPQRVQELLNQNPRVVFFRELAVDDASAGPVGTLGVALTAEVSVAVDPRCLPLGAPLLLQTTAPSNEALARIVMAQDTGSAIRGALRIDWFWGQGAAAAQFADRKSVV